MEKGEYILKTEKALNCILCNKEIHKSIHSEDDDWDIAMVDDGVFVKSQAGYGSKHDCSHIFFVICDECIDSKSREGSLILID